jgi:hypothetical protein
MPCTGIQERTQSFYTFRGRRDIEARVVLQFFCVTWEGRAEDRRIRRAEGLKEGKGESEGGEGGEERRGKGEERERREGRREGRKGKGGRGGKNTMDI